MKIFIVKLWLILSILEENICLGFTELAKRFPQDFKRLIQSFSEEKEQLIKNPPVTKSVRFGGLQNKESLPSPQRNSFTSDFRSSGTCVKPDSPPHGKVKKMAR